MIGRNAFFKWTEKFETNNNTSRGDDLSTRELETSTGGLE
jgi:hypothetical protein